MRYYGAKTKLLPFIEEVVKKTGVNSDSNFVDLFAGTSAVGRHFKKLGYTVISNDTLEFSYAIAKTYIELNKVPQFKKLKAHLKLRDGNEALFGYMNKLKMRKQGFIFENYSPNGGRQYFTDENALRIDTLRGVNLTSNVSGTYGAFLKTWDKRALKPLEMEEVEIIPSKNKNKAYKRDANELIKEIHSDILYLDPPYNSRQYASNYFILELIAEGWFKETPKIYGETGMREYNHQKSRYCLKSSALNALEDLILNSSKAQFIILSYNNEGVISWAAIQQTLAQIGSVEIFTENQKGIKGIDQMYSYTKAA